MYCSREYQASTRLIQQYEKSTLNYTKINFYNGHYAILYEYMLYFITKLMLGIY